MDSAPDANAPATRILSEEQARAYLGGRNPSLVMQPVKIGGRNCWDRKALDRKLDTLFGIGADAAQAGNETPLERWRKDKRRGGEDAA